MDEETAELRSELAGLAAQLRVKQEEVSGVFCIKILAEPLFLCQGAGRCQPGEPGKQVSVTKDQSTVLCRQTRSGRFIVDSCSRVNFCPTMHGALLCRPGKASTKKLLKGHINKVTCVHFSGDSRYRRSPAVAWQRPQPPALGHLSPLSLQTWALKLNQPRQQCKHLESSCHLLL